jgi:choline transport protein
MRRTPDCVSHLAEEIPDPRRNIPLAIAAQMVIGFITAFVFLVAIFYSITSLDSVLNSPITTFPLAEIYYQATSSQAGTLGLLFLIFLPILCTCIGTYLTAGRTLWALARDGATPFSNTLGEVSQRWKNPFNATLACGVISSLLGCIYIGSSTAFNAFVGSFIVLSTLSYLAAILPFILTHRFTSREYSSKPKNANLMIPGPFQMGTWTGYIVNITSCIYIVVFVVIYCFPYSLPVEADSMNYSSPITGVLTAMVGVWWFVRGNGGRYVGPRAMAYTDEDGGCRPVGYDRYRERGNE